MSTILFKEHSPQEHAAALAGYLPGGNLFSAARIEGCIFYKLFLGLAHEMKRAEEQFHILPLELDPRTTTLFIDEWEQNVGIPDDCFPVADTLEERRLNILLKLTSLGVQTEADFKGLAAILGFTITITRPTGISFPPYDVPFTPQNERFFKFTWIVTADNIVLEIPPYDVPFTPVADPGSTILQCLFNKLKPANTEIIFENL